VAITPFTLQFVGGVPVDANSNFTSTKASIVSGVAAAATLTVSLRDASSGGGLASGGYPVTLSASPVGGLVFASATGTSDGSGLFSTTVTGGRAGSYTAQAQVNLGGSVLTLTKTVVIAVTFGDAARATSTVTAAPNAGVIADGATPTSVSAIVLDTAQNPVMNAALSVNVTFASKVNVQGTNYVPTGADPNSVTFPATTNAQGAFSFSVFATAAGAKDVRLDVPRASGTGTASLAFTGVVTFVGAPAPGKSTLTASPTAGGTSVVADGAATWTLVANVRDAASQPAGGVAVTLVSTDGSDVIAPASASTSYTAATLGTAVFTLSSLNGGPHTLTLVGPGWTAATPGAPQVTVIFDYRLPDPAKTFVNVTANPSPATTVTTDPGGTATVTVTVGDSIGRPIGGLQVCLSVSGSNNALTPVLTGAACTAQGVAGNLVTLPATGPLSYSLSSTKAETKTVALQATGAAGVFAKSASVQFTVGALAQAVFTSYPGNQPPLLSDGATRIRLGFRLTDAGGNAITSKPTVSFTGSAGSRLIFPDQVYDPGSTADAAGNVYVNAGSSAYQTATATVTVRYGAATLGSKSFALSAPAFAMIAAGLQGGKVDSVTADPTTAGVVYASGGNGPYKSTDSGNTWTPINLGLEDGAIWAGGVGSRVWALSPFFTWRGSTVARSDDGGATYTFLSTPGPYPPNRLVIDVTNTNHLLTGQAGFPPLYTPDGGLTWVSSTLPAAISGLAGLQTIDVAFEPGNASIVYAMLQDSSPAIYLLRSNDGGVSFSNPSGAALPSSSCTAGMFTGGLSFDSSAAPPALYFNCSTKFFKSTDRAVSISAPFAPANNNTTDFLVATNDSSGLRLLSGGLQSGLANYGLFESRAAGGSWSPLKSGGLDYAGQGYSASINYVASSPKDPGTVYVVRPDTGVLRITGASPPYTLTDLTLGPAAANVTCLRKDPTAGSQTVYAMTPAGLFASSDSTLKSWSPVSTAGVPSLKEGSFQVAANGAVLLSVANGTLWRRAPAGSTFVQLAAPPVSGLFFSTAESSAVELPSGAILAWYFSNSVGWAAYRTTDVGATWTALSGAPDRFFWEPRAGGRVYGFDPATNNLAFSADNGATWTSSFVPGSSNPITMVRFDGLNVWAGSYHALFSAPLGAVGNANWTASPVPTLLLELTADLAKSSNLLALTNTGPPPLQRSTDAGVSYSSLGTGVPMRGSTDQLTCSRLYSNGAVGAVGIYGRGLFGGPTP
jgi:hypothetical protein